MGCVNIPKTEPTLEQRLVGAMRLMHYSRQTELTAEFQVEP